MFRIVFSLDCDDCGQPFPSATLATEQSDNLQSLKWLQPVEILLALADMNGWSAYDTSQLCSDCLYHYNRMAELYQFAPGQLCLQFPDRS
jgi:hypothetical protein